MADEIKLTAKQRIFAEEYAICLNATEAARRAGYSKARQSGSENLSNPVIYTYIQDLLKKKQMGTDEILSRLAAQGRADIGDFIDPATNAIDWKMAKAEGITHLIKEIEQTTTITEDSNGGGRETHVFKIKLYDAQAALIHLGKAAGIFTERVDHTSGGKPIQINIVEVVKPADPDQ